MKTHTALNRAHRGDTSRATAAAMSSVAARAGAALLLLLSLLALAPTARAAFIFNVDRTIGAGSLTGTIETAILGSFSSPSQDIVGGSLTFTLDGTSTVLDLATDLTFGFVGGASAASALVADTSGLTFDFSAGSGSGGVSFFMQSTASLVPFWCLEGANRTAAFCGTPLDAGSEWIFDSTTNFEKTSGLTGKVTIGTLVPEAATLALLGGGLLLLGLSRRRASGQTVPGSTSSPGA